LALVLGAGAPGCVPASTLPPPCDRRTVFCVNARGIPLNGEHNPHVTAGEGLTVAVYDAPSTVKDRIVKLDSTGVQSVTQDFSNLLPVAGPGGATVLSEMHVDQLKPSTDLTVNLSVSDTAVKTNMIVQRPITFSVGNAGYIFEPTFMFPTIVQGARTVGVTAFPNGVGGVVHSSRSTLGALDNFSLGINIYPLGGYPPSGCSRADSDTTLWEVLSNFVPFVCYPKYLLRPLALQAGVSISNNAFKEYFLGFGYSVVRGVVVSVGGAFVPGQFLGPTTFEGQIVPANTQLDIETKWMVRPYISVAFSPEILQAALDVLNQAKALGAVHGGD
jgi:hypothetical protein